MKPQAIVLCLLLALFQGAHAQSAWPILSDFSPAADQQQLAQLQQQLSDANRQLLEDQIRLATEEGKYFANGSTANALRTEIGSIQNQQAALVVKERQLYCKYEELCSYLQNAPSTFDKILTGENSTLDKNALGMLCGTLSQIQFPTVTHACGRGYDL